MDSKNLKIIWNNVISEHTMKIQQKLRYFIIYIILLFKFYIIASFNYFIFGTLLLKYKSFLMAESSTHNIPF